MSRLNHFTVIFCLGVVMQVSVAAADSSETSGEDLTPSLGTENEISPNIDCSQDMTPDRQSGFKHRLQEISSWLEELPESYADVNYKELSPPSRGQLLGMSKGFGTRPPKEDYDSGFWRNRKSQLSRMPMSYGKRYLFAVSEDDLYEGAEHSRSDSDDLPRARRGKLGRMPMAFGKRSEPSVANTDADGKNNVSDMQRIFSFDYQTDVDDAFTRVTKGKLGRMPMAYGKRDKLGRMPMAFGKRDKLGRMPMAFGKRDKLGRMPMAFGKRDKLGRMPMAFGKRDKLGRMPMAFGKRGKLGRMPMAFGKRDYHRTPYNEDMYSLFTESLKETLSRPYLNSENSNHGEHYTQFENIVATNVPDDKVLSNSENGVRTDNERSNQYSRISRGSLNRMPMSFGKRASSEKMAVILGNSEQVAAYKDGITSILDKRNENKNLALFQILGYKINSLKPENIDLAHDQVKTLLNQFLTKENSLTRLTRSRLERVPVTYGKRGEGHSAQLGDSGPMYSRVIPPKLGKVPPAYGKRMLDSTDPRNLSKQHPSTSGIHGKVAQDTGDRITESWSSHGDPGEATVQDVAVSKETSAMEAT